MAGGRPNKYTTNIEPFIDEIRILRANGIEYDKIAKMLNIAPSTLYKHKAEIGEFSEYVKIGDDELIGQYEKSLHSLALGTYIAVKEKTVYEADRKTVKSYEVTKEYGKPDLGAIVFGSTNIAPDKWKNKQSVTTMPYDEIEEDMEDYEK